MGITLGEIVNDIGGGPPGGGRVKAVQTGGPSGGCIPAARFDLRVDYDSLAEAGSIMGSGGMIVMDENTCMVDVAKYFMNFLKDESCGKCFTCRKGTQRMWEILDDITSGRGTLDQLDLLEELALVVKDTTMCGLGQTAANPVLSTLRYFREEYERHIAAKKCDALVCNELVGAPCQAACPIGTEAWRYVAHIARGEYDLAYQAIREANPFPSVCARVCNHPCEEHCRAGLSGAQPVAIRALKRFITDRSDPMAYKPARRAKVTEKSPRVAVVGAGPAGLSAAHYLSLAGHKVTVFEADPEPGGMLFSAIPGYRLPREVVRKEIASILDENITVKCNTTLGRDVTLDDLFASGFQAVFIALGAHKSLALGLPNEDAEGVLPSIRFLKAFNMGGEELARGRVGVIGGGNSAVDAARMALRQKDVTEVTIYYRRSMKEMPAFAEEIEAAQEEGVRIEALTAPVRILTQGGRLTGIECITNRLGEIDASGRRAPVPVAGSERTVPLDTLIVAISEGSDTDCISVAGANRIETTKQGTVRVDRETLLTNRPGVFAGGDVVTGPNTVVDAIAAGKRAAVMIERHLRGEALKQPSGVRLPDVYVEPAAPVAGEPAEGDRVETPRLSSRGAPAQLRRGGEGALGARRRPRSAALSALRSHLHRAQARATGAGRRRQGGAEMMKITINGLETTVERGTTVLEAAQFLGFPIPTLCHMEGLTPYGACRLCVVEIGEGPKSRLVTSCTYPGRGGTEGAHRVGPGGAGAQDDPRTAAGILPAVEGDPGSGLRAQRPPAAFPPGARRLHPVRALRAHVLGADGGGGHRLRRSRREPAESVPRSTSTRRCAASAAAASTYVRRVSCAAPIANPTKRSVAVAPTCRRPASRKSSSTT